jgi:hypothetical protein
MAESNMALLAFYYKIIDIRFLDDSSLFHDLIQIFYDYFDFFTHDLPKLHTIQQVIEKTDNRARSQKMVEHLLSILRNIDIDYNFPSNVDPEEL